ncbi:MAG: hypothetical protein OQK97_12115, partial [Deltaproteobacteria bacterium]|nr:hypothetical protein [Deltaproteobacteria bacterium]
KSYRVRLQNSKTMFSLSLNAVKKPVNISVWVVTGHFFFSPKRIYKTAFFARLRKIALSALPSLNLKNSYNLLFLKLKIGF